MSSSDNFPLTAYRPAGPVQFQRTTHTRSICWIMFLVLAGGAATVFHLPQSQHDTLRKWVDQLAVSAGLGVDHVAVIGYRQTPISQIAGALDLDTDKSLLGFNSDVVRRRLQQLPWIETVRVAHILPDTVSIRITERKPFAVWQNKGKYYLIDRSGHTLAQHEGRLNELQYPLVVGKGAGVTARQFLDQVGPFPAIAQHVKAAVRVADRRWNLLLRSGKKILLPEHGLRSALTTLEALFANKTITAKNIAMIDLRIPARPTVRLQANVSRTLKDIKQSRRAAALLLAGDAS